MGRLSGRIAEELRKGGVISEEDYPLYEYGLHEIEVTALNIVTDLLIAALMGMFLEGIVFLVIYVPLRRFAGGYHAETELRCYGLSALLVFLALCAIRVTPGSLTVHLPLFLCASAVIFFLAPVGTANKPLDTTEYCVYRRKSRSILFFHWAGAVVLWLFSFRTLVITIVVSDVIMGIMLVLGAIKNRVGSGRISEAQ